MRILAVDMGTGTQDILLFDPAQPVESVPEQQATQPESDESTGDD